MRSCQDTVAAQGGSRGRGMGRNGHRDVRGVGEDDEVAPVNPQALNRPHPWDFGAVTPTRNCSGIPNQLWPAAGQAPGLHHPPDPTLCHPLAPSKGDFSPWKCPCCSTHPARINKSLCFHTPACPDTGLQQIKHTKKSLLCLLPSLEFFHSQD